MLVIRFADFFCGGGGFRLGLERANTITQPSQGESQERWDGTLDVKGTRLHGRFNPSFTCVWANDNDKYTCQIYRKHWNDGTLHEGDIRTTDVDTIPDFDLLCAGFPCQSFSIAGKRRGFEDTRGTLFFEICRIIRIKKPQYLFLENVKGLLSASYTVSPEFWDEDDFDSETGELSARGLARHRIIGGTKGFVFTTILQSLDELGYDCQWQVLNSKDFGVPQNRERVFIIGHLRGKPRPKVFPIGEGYIQNDEDGRGIMREQFDVSGKGYGSQQDRVYNPKGLMACLPNAHPDNKLNIFVPEIAQALQTDGQLRQGVSWGTDKPQSTRNIRRLTPLECERLQSFPDGWTEGISDTQRYKCLGNAVTVNVIEAIGRQLVMELV